MSVINVKNILRHIDIKKTIRLIYPQLEYMSTPHIDLKLRKWVLRRVLILIDILNIYVMLDYCFHQINRYILQRNFSL